MPCKYARTDNNKHIELMNGYKTTCWNCNGIDEPGCGAPHDKLNIVCPKYIEAEEQLDFKPGKLINWLISQQELSDKLNDKAAIIASINQEQFGDLMHDDELKESQKLFITKTLQVLDKNYHDLAEWDSADDEYQHKYKQLREKIKAMSI